MLYWTTRKKRTDPFNSLRTFSSPCSLAKFYDHVEVCDVVDYLNRQETLSVDIVCSADTFIYVGKLEEVFLEAEVSESS